jgi:lipoprotein-anchoring transpeptidase ErfK/SrfK
LNLSGYCLDEQAGEPIVEGVMSRRASIYASVIAAAALSCGTATAQPLFAFLAAPAQTQAAPRYEPIPAEQGEEDTQLDPRLKRQVVDYRTSEAPGTVIVDTPHTYLYYVLGGGKAIRYGIGVGREGFTWSGVKQVARKAEWPDWHPPAEMVARQPYLPRFVAGGPGNPLGARAMYIGGTVYRIHGTNAPSTIGQQVSSGCIRMLNEDVIDLYNRVQVGAKVIVLPQTYEAKTKSPSHQAQAPVQLTSSFAPTSEGQAARAWATIR